MIIGIAGEANSGKDTIASMINYIISVGITKAKYSDWLIYQNRIGSQKQLNVIHFADNLKDCLSIIYNIPREYFDDRKKKDKEYYLLNEQRFVDEKTFKTKYYEVTFESLGDYSLNELIYDDITDIGIKLRTLMQYFGTNICRNLLDQDIWVKSTIDKARELADIYKICLIPDVRYVNEANAIRALYPNGKVIRVIRDNNNSSSNHSSEIIDFNVDIIIENNKTKMQLFYKVIEVYKSLNK